MLQIQEAKTPTYMAI